MPTPISLAKGYPQSRQLIPANIMHQNIIKMYPHFLFLTIPLSPNSDCICLPGMNAFTSFGYPVLTQWSTVLNNNTGWLCTYKGVLITQLSKLDLTYEPRSQLTWLLHNPPKNLRPITNSPSWAPWELSSLPIYGQSVVKCWPLSLT